MPDQENKKWIVQMPMEVEAETAHEALAKVSVQEGCRVININVMPRQQQQHIPHPPTPPPFARSPSPQGTS